MDLEKSNHMKDKFRRFIPNRSINDGWHYYELHGANMVIAIRINLPKTYAVVEEGGQPVINQNTKLPILEWNHEIESKLLTIDEFEAIKESGFCDGDLK